MKIPTIHHKFSLSKDRLQLFIFLITFGAIGGLIILFSHAATSSGSIEPESGTPAGNVSVVTTNPSASGGNFVKFGAATTGRCQHTTTRICYNGKLWNVNGVNVPWITWNSDFGGGGVVNNQATIASGFSQLHNTGSTVVRWWMFEGGAPQINRDSSGMPTSLNQAIYPDIDAALALASQYNLYYNFTLFSGVGAGDFPTTWRTNAAQRMALANVLAPLFARYKDNPRVMSWELFNEPEWQIWNNTDGANATDTVALANALVSSIRTNAPKALTTIGEARIDGIPMWKNVDLDFDSPHWYDPMVDSYDSALLNTAAQLQAANGMTRPIVLGEFPFVGNTAQNLARLNQWYSNGYAGAWNWSLFWDNTSDKLKPDLPAETTFFSQHSDIGPQ